MKLGSVALVAALLTWPVPSRPNDQPPAPEAPTYEFNMCAGALSDSLRQLYTQSGFVASVWGDVEPDAVHTNSVEGAFTIEQAMAVFLADTGLSHTNTNEPRVVVARTQDAPLERTLSSTRYRFDWPSQSLAEAVFALSSQTHTPIALDVSDKALRSTIPPLRATLTVAEAADYIIASQSTELRRAAGELRWHWRSKTLRFYNEAPSPITTKAEARGSTAIEAIIVTGSRLPSSSAVPMPAFSPIQQFDRDFLRSFNVGSAGEILNYSPQQPYRRADFYFLSEDYAELRGFGFDTTTVLIDGQRTFPSSVTRNSVDLSSIPAVLIDRIDVLSDSGSAAHGGEAMGGVLNVVLRKHFENPELELEYGGADGGARMRRGSLGFSLTTDALTTTMAFEGYSREILLGSSRSLWRDQDYRRYGLSDYRSRASNPATVYSLSGSNLPGLGSPIAAAPHLRSDRTVTIADFAETQGLRNYESLSRYYTVSPTRTQNTAYIFSEFRWTDTTKISGGLLLVDATRAAQDEPVSLNGAIMSAANPYNPFGVDIGIDYLLSAAGPTKASVDSDWARASVSAEHRIGNLVWTNSALASREKLKSERTRANAERARAALMQTDPVSALNPFSSGFAYNDAVFASLVDKTVDRQESKGEQVSSVLEGSLKLLGDNLAHFRVGLEWRHESALLNSRSAIAPQTVDAARNVRSIYSEIELPLSGEKEHGMALTVSGRLDDYSDAGTAINPRIGAVWQPTRDLTFRTSYGESTRPASLFEMYTPQIIIPHVRIPDPLRGNEITPITYTSGGNSSIKPSSSRSFTVSALWDPIDEPWHLLQTYWSTEIDDRVVVASTFDILKNPSAYPGRIVRDTPSDQDVAAGRPGRLLSLDGTRINGGLIQTSGIDLQAQYETINSFATVTLGLGATWTGVFRYRTLPGITPVDAVNKARSVYGTIPRWRVAASLGAEFESSRLAIFANWIPDYDDATVFNQPNGRRIDSRTVVDLQTSINLAKISDGFLTEGAWLHLGAKNVFNRMPDSADVGSIFGYDVTQSDLVGRQWYLKLSKDF